MGYKKGYIKKKKTILCGFKRLIIINMDWMQRSFQVEMNGRGHCIFQVIS